MEGTQKVQLVVLAVSIPDKGKYVALAVSSETGKITTTILIYVDRPIDMKKMKEICQDAAGCAKMQQDVPRCSRMMSDAT